MPAVLPTQLQPREKKKVAINAAARINGLSYSKFTYNNVKLSGTKLKTTDVLTVSFDLTNAGKYDATEVAQLYVQDKFGSVARPVKELKRFDRIALKAGETKTVTFTLPVEELAFWNIDMQHVVEAGDFNLWVGPNSQEGIESSFVVE